MAKKCVFSDSGRYSMGKISGFTLVELLTVMTIAGILIVFGVPAYQELAADYRLRKAAVDFQNALTLAKSEAVRRGEQIDVNPIGGNWSNGWQVALPAALGGGVLYTFDAVNRIVVNRVGGGTIGQISYQNDGYRNDYIITTPINAISFQIRFCDYRNKGRQLGIIVTGVSGVDNVTSNCTATPPS